jgi:hypothetical protein
MNGFGDLQLTLLHMGFTQLGLAFAILTCYAIALSGMIDLRVRAWSVAVGAAAAVAFAVVTTPWEHGVMLLAFGVGALGLFALLVWSISGMLGLRSMPETESAAPASKGRRARRGFRWLRHT